MITRKGLEAIVAAVADLYAAGTVDREGATVAAAHVIEKLRDAGQVTPNYDPARFSKALSEALA